MILTLPKIGPVRFDDNLTDAQFSEQLTALSKKYGFELPPELDLTTGEMASRAFERGKKRLGSTFGDIIPAMAAKGLGFDEVAKQQMQEAAETEEEIQRYYRPQYPTLESVKGPGDFPGFALETLVEQVPNIATSLIPGLGAAGVATRAGLGVAGRTAAANVGTFLGSYAQNAPEVFQNIYDQTGQMEVGTALLFGAGSAALDSVLPASLARQLTGPVKVGVVENILAKSGMDSRLLRTTTAGVLKGIGVEGLTEGAQEAINISAENFVSQNPQIFESKDWNRIMEASVRGAIAGGGFGAVGGGVEGLRAKAQEMRAAAEKAAQERRDEEAKKLLAQAKELEDMADRQQQMELPGVEREGVSTSLTKDYLDAIRNKAVPPEGIAAKAAVDAKQALSGKQLELFTPTGELTKEAEKAATADQKRVAAQQKAEQEKLKQVVSGKQMTLPGFTPEELKAQEAQRTALEQQAAETGQGDLFAGMPAPRPPDTLIGTDKDALRSFGKKFGIGPTASILKTDGPLAGKDIANPQDAAEVKRALEAYASGKPAAGAAEKIAEYLKRPEFAALEGVTDERVATEAVSPRGEPGVSVPSGAEAGVGVTPTPTEPTGAGVEPAGKPAAGPGVRAKPVSPALKEPANSTPKKRGRPPLQLTPEQQQARLQARQASQATNKGAVRAANKLLKDIQTPFDETQYTAEELFDAQQEYDAKVVDTLMKAYRIANDPALRQNEAGRIAQEVINQPNVTQRQREIAQNRIAREPKPAKALPIDTTNQGLDDVYYDFLNASEALEYIAKTGTAFEKFLATRLAPALKNVKLEIIFDPSEITNAKVKKEFIDYNPAGVYHNKVIYLDGQEGVNNETFLHEAIHAATVAKLHRFAAGLTRSPSETQFFNTAKVIQGRAKRYYDEMIARADADPEYALRHANVIYTMRQLANSSKANVFNNTAEFFSYGLTNPDMQEFLMMAPGLFKKDKDTSLFTKFVNAIRNVLGLGDQYSSAFQDLLIVTDQVVKPTKVSEDGISPSKALNLARETLNLTGQIGMNMPKLTGKAVENTKNMMSNLPTNLTSIMAGILRMDNLNTMYGKELPSIQSLLDAIEKRYGMQEQGIKRVSDNYEKFTKIMRAYPDAVERMNDMAYDARLAQVDLLDENFKPQPNQQAEYNKLKNTFNNLPKEVQDVYRTIRKDYDNAIKEYEKILFGDDKTGEKGVLEGAAAKELRAEYELRKRQIAYIPFLRRGDFWVEYTGDDGQRYAHAFQSSRERDTFIREELQGKPHQTYLKLEEINYRKSEIPPTSFVGKIVSNLVKKGASEDQINNVYQAYLSLFPAESLAKRFMKADNIRGMERDVIRGYGDTMVKWERKLASSKYSPEIDKAISEISEQAKASGKETLEIVANNIRAQQDFIHNPTYGKLVNSLTTFSYFEYIAGNISSAVVNLSTLPLFSWPMLGGKFGFDKASSALLRGSKVAMNGMEKDPRYRNLYNELMAHAQLEHTTAREVLEGRREKTSEYVGIKAKIMNGLSYPFSAVERVNRGATAIAAYDLAKGSGMSEKEAIRYALTMVKDINTSGMSATSPRWMQTPVGRIFFTFKSFTYNSAFIIARAFHQAFKGESPEVRSIARRQLLGIYAMSMAFSGVKGLPFMGAVTTLAEMISALFGDDEEPFDAQMELREFFGELGYKGALNYFLNLEIANRTGIAQDIIYKDDPRGVAENGLFLTALKQGMGPAGSYLWGAERAFKDMAEGHTDRAIEALSPSWVRNLSKGGRYWYEGATTRKGDAIDADISGWNIAMQMVGFAPADLSSTYERISAAKGFEREIQASRTKILNLYTMARKSGDMDLRAEAEERRIKFNEANPNYKITNSTLQRSAAASKAAEKDLIRGIRFNSKLRPEIEEKFFEDEED